MTCGFIIRGVFRSGLPDEAGENFFGDGRLGVSKLLSSGKALYLKTFGMSSRSCLLEMSLAGKICGLGVASDGDRRAEFNALVNA